MTADCGPPVGDAVEVAVGVRVATVIVGLGVVPVAVIVGLGVLSTTLTESVAATPCVSYAVRRKVYVPAALPTT
jgi:hypothetical protein